MKDKNLTKRKLIDAVGEIINSKGFRAVRTSSVARIAGVDRKLVYRYFGNLNNLTETYIIENDYWMLFSDQLKKLLNEAKTEESGIIISGILQELFKFFLQEKEMQNLILMELNGGNRMMQSIHNARESLGQDFLEITDPHFINSTVNFRAVSALLVGGIYYIILHTRSNGNKFADINVKSDDGASAILETIGQVVEWAFKAAGMP
jgi:AcrR family transcriptional regulator